MSDATKPACPRGHEVNTSFGQRRCSGKRCAQAWLEEQRQQKDKERSALSKVEQVGEGELAYAQRRQLAGLPATPMTPEESKAWAENKLAQMVPEAVTVLQWDLRNGTDRQRSEAAKQVMQANGLDRREAAAAKHMPTIVLNFGKESNVPWLERLPKKKPNGDS